MVNSGLPTTDPELCFTFPSSRLLPGVSAVCLLKFREQGSYETENTWPETHDAIYYWVNKDGRMKLLNITQFLTSGLLCGAFTFALAQNSPSQHQLPSRPVQRPEIPHLPAPSGPFGIGRIGYEWIDTSRPEVHSADPQAHRDLMVFLW